MTVQADLVAALTETLTALQTSVETKHGRKGDPLYEALYHPGNLGMGTWKNRDEYARVLDRFLRDPEGSQDEPWKDRTRRPWNPVIDGGMDKKPQGFNEGPPVYSIWEPVDILPRMPGVEPSMYKPSGKTEPIKYVYRSMTDVEFQEAIKRGYIQSDQRGCIIPGWEGTNAAVTRSSATAYLPNSDIGRIVKIKVDPKDGWFTSDADSYLRTRGKVPVSAIVAATPPIFTDQHGSPITKEWVDRNGWKYPPEGKAVRHVRTPRGARFYGQSINSVITADPVVSPLYGNMFSTARGKGGTLNVLTGEKPTSGFCVAERGKNREIPETIFFDPERGKAALKAYIRDHADDLGDGKWLGLWHDVENREMTLDVVLVIGDREQAIQAGIANNQQAIYDVAADDVLFTGGTGDRAAEGKRLHGTAPEAGEGDDGSGTGRVGGRGLSGDDGRKVRHVRTPRGVARFGQAIGTALGTDEMPMHEAQPMGMHVRTDHGMHMRKPRPAFHDALKAREFYGAVTFGGSVNEDLARQMIAGMSDDQIQRLIKHISQMRYSNGGEHMFSHRYGNATDILAVLHASQNEKSVHVVTEKKVRRVRTAAGVKFFGLPIGSVIGFTGTRDGMTKEQRSKVAQIVKGVAPKMTHHGDAVGADTDFHRIARRLKVPIHKHPSNLPAAVQGNNKDATTTSKPKPPLERNKDIVARSKVIIATPKSDKEEQRSGTWATIRNARKTKTPVIIVFPDGTVKREGFAAPTPTPVAAPVSAPVVVPNTPVSAAPSKTVNLRYDKKPSPNFPKGFEKVITPSGEWYHVGNVKRGNKDNWRVYKGDDYSRKGIVFTRGKDRLAAIQWIRDKHRNDVVAPIGKGTNSTVRTPEDDKRYQHRVKLTALTAAELTRLHDMAKVPDDLEWRVIDGHLITDSYAGFNDVLKRIKRSQNTHARLAKDQKLTPNQRTHHRHLARKVPLLDKDGKPVTVTAPVFTDPIPAPGVLAGSIPGTDAPGVNNVREVARDDQGDPVRTRPKQVYVMEGRLADVVKELNDLHNMGPLVHQQPALNEVRAWARAIDLVQADDVLTRQSPLARWARSGGKMGTTKRVLANLNRLIERRRKAGLDTTDAQELLDWMDQRVKPTITRVDTPMVPRTHHWRRPPDPNRRLGGAPTMYQGQEIWISDVTFDDPNNPGHVVNLKFTKTKHDDGTYSITYPDGHTEYFPTSREAGVAANAWLRKRTPLVTVEAKDLLAGILYDIQAALETKVRHVVDADYWGMPVGTPLTGHEYRAHPRLRIAHMVTRGVPRQSGASKPDPITKHPSKYEDYDFYKDSTGREFYVGEVEDGLWVATRGDDMNVWPVTGMTQGEVLRELRKYVERTMPAPAPAAAPAPAKRTVHLHPKTAKKAPAAKKTPAAKKPVKAPQKPRKVAKRVPAKKAPAKRAAAPTAPAKPTPRKKPFMKPRTSVSHAKVGSRIGQNARGDDLFLGPTGRKYTKFTAHNQDGHEGMHPYNEKRDAAALKERGLVGQTAGPNAWPELWIADDLDNGGRSWDGGFSGVYAVGRDSKGGRQSRQLKARRTKAQVDKWPRINELASLLPVLDKAMKRDRGDDTADCLFLISRTGMRPSSEKDTGAAIENFGATTFQVKHVHKTAGGNLRIQMDSAKKGFTDLTITDKELVGVILNHMKGKKPGDQVFSGTDEIALRDYMRDNLPRFSGDGKVFQVKDLRTVIGTAIAWQEIADIDKRENHLPTTQTEFRAWLKEACLAVSAQLCNKPNQAAKSYIDPAVWDNWLTNGTTDWIPKAYQSEAL